jgi:N-acetylglucosamine malate deacetylase 2
MVVVAHPGDEAFGFAGAIATAAATGAYVVVVCATRGYFDSRLVEKPPAPGGKSRPFNRPVVWRNLDTVREDELRRSVALLGVRVLRMLDYAEGELASIDFDELTSRIVEPIRMHRPEVILTFGPDGVTGDPEHAIVSRATTLAFELAGHPLAYEDDLEEDQVAWRAAKLYHLVMPQSAVDLLGEQAPTDGYGSSDTEASLALALEEFATLKLAAIGRHVSQIGSDGPFAGWEPEARDRYLATEHYRLVRSNVAVPAALLQSPEASLFDGLP